MLGAILVFFPAVLVAIRIGREVPQNRVWHVIRSKSPAWVPYGQYLLFAYFIICVILFGSAPQGSAANVHIMTAADLAFSYVSASVFYAAYRSPDLLLPHRCENGHPVSPLDKFCPQCGTPISRAA